MRELVFAETLPSPSPILIAFTLCDGILFYQDACGIADYFHGLLCTFTCFRTTEATIYFSCPSGEMHYSHKRHQTEPFPC